MCNGDPNITIVANNSILICTLFVTIKSTCEKIVQIPTSDCCCSDPHAVHLYLSHIVYESLGIFGILDRNRKVSVSSGCKEHEMSEKNINGSYHKILDKKTRNNLKY